MTTDPLPDTFTNWSAGYGVIRHRKASRERAQALMATLVEQGHLRNASEGWQRLAAADRLCSLGLWLVAHMTYAQRVYADGTPLAADDFKRVPEGHTGGALNMVPAYTGYLLANALCGETRSWLMGQGHCVAAIDALNLLAGNLSPAHADRYTLDDDGLATFVQDFYRYTVAADGLPASPLGSHVNCHTAGGISEGGYLGFAELQYPHMPLPGQRLVAFLSDGAFEEQRGSDWAPRWWRAEDCGSAVPVMIANGRRIDQRTTLSQSGGVQWFGRHLRLNGFDPLFIDGRDPFEFAWAIIEAESRLQKATEAIRDGRAHYPVALPYVIAKTVKGFGLPGAGTNAAHNLPLPGNPANNANARHQFQRATQRLHVAPAQWPLLRAQLANHADSGRPQEKDHALARIVMPLPICPGLPRLPTGELTSPMATLDAWFVALVDANPSLRVRIGNPDEMRSNRLNLTLDRLQHRVTAPEPGNPEDLHGSVITALNEEAVISAVLGNKQGLNLCASYEAFAVKMLGAMRQEILFARQQRLNDQQPGWLSLPIIATSHTWENGKNEQSHQDPTLAEAWLGEMEDVAPVLFPVDAISACAAAARLYHSHGRIGLMVIPKNPVPLHLDEARARQLASDGILHLSGSKTARIQLLAIGAYQLQEALRAAERLCACGHDTSVYVLMEPGRLRIPRDQLESEMVHDDAHLSRLLPSAHIRIIVTHTRPEPMLGVLRRIDLGATHTAALGYINRGGTLDTFGMLFANRCSWAHIVARAVTMLGDNTGQCLSGEERAALNGRADPALLR